MGKLKLYSIGFKTNVSKNGFIFETSQVKSFHIVKIQSELHIKVSASSNWIKIPSCTSSIKAVRQQVPYQWMSSSSSKFHGYALKSLLRVRGANIACPVLISRTLVDLGRHLHDSSCRLTFFDFYHGRSYNAIIFWIHFHHNGVQCLFD